jgi:hypothetical protein
MLVLFLATKIEFSEAARIDFSEAKKKRQLFCEVACLIVAVVLIIKNGPSFIVVVPGLCAKSTTLIEGSGVS